RAPSRDGAPAAAALTLVRPQVIFVPHVWLIHAYDALDVEELEGVERRLSGLQVEIAHTAEVAPVLETIIPVPRVGDAFEYLRPARVEKVTVSLATVVDGSTRIEVERRAVRELGGPEHPAIRLRGVRREHVPTLIEREGTHELPEISAGPHRLELSRHRGIEYECREGDECDDLDPPHPRRGPTRRALCSRDRLGRGEEAVPPLAGTPREARKHHGRRTG